MRAIGLMSGTSLDGIDVALLDTDGDARVEAGPSATFGYSDDDRALLRSALEVARTLDDRNARPGALDAAERMITARHAEAVSAFLGRFGLARETVDVVGFHGQTVLHRPERRLTVQIGDGGALARDLGLRVVADMRAADVAAGGQGAPLVPAYHRALVHAAGWRDPTLVINIGGVANVTLVHGDADPVACDTGPGNALLDDMMLERTGVAMDTDGALAATGRVDPEALARLLDHPFFALPPPKSLDRNDFSKSAVDHLADPDAAATLVAFTAASIGCCVDHLPSRPVRAIVCGGGSRNPTLMKALAARTGFPVQTGEECGWQSDAIEAQAFAYLAVRALDGKALTFPTTTGVPHPLPGGLLHRP